VIGHSSEQPGRAYQIRNFEEGLVLANHKSAIKRARQSEDRRQRNRARKTRMKTVVKAVEQAISSNQADLAVEKLKEAIAVIDKSAGKGVIHKNKAARKISRLTRHVNDLSAKTA
jgi:small subunit ribosomal protein S20